MSLTLDPDLPIGTALSGLFKHGGLQNLADPARRAQMAAKLATMADAAQAMQMMQKAGGFFYMLVEGKPYTLSNALIDHIVAKDTGLVFNTGDQPSPDILAPMTFVGQFIDHDLTLNAVNLLMQTPIPNQVDEASPLIDLDSVFGPRIDDANPGKLRAVPQDPDGTFQLHHIENGPDVDVMRGADKNALIGDKRNDENQIILQVHLLMMRLNNALIRTKRLAKAEAQRQTILHWQSFVITQYLKLVCRRSELDLVGSRLRSDPALLLHHPVNGQVRMPHEFAIGFRFGHSQLRDAYQLQRGKPPFPLFDVAAGDDPDGLYDLRGGKYLAPDHVIDWPFFLGAAGGAPDHSNLIDTKVNQVVFDLPPSTIPDDDKQIVNLPQRNLIRSSGLGLCAGEDLVAAYNAHYGPAHAIAPLTPDQVVNGGDKTLFQSNGAFRTPLWYYILREAEFRSGQDGGAVGQLGPLGSRLVAEVLLTAVQFAKPSYLGSPEWRSMIPVTTGDDRSVALLDIVRFVTASE